MLVFDSLTPPLPQALASALRRLAHLAHTSSWDHWASHRLTPTQRKILHFLATRSEPVTLSAVASDLQVTPATASDSMAALEAKGLVHKRRSTVDGRAVAIALTDEGREAVLELEALPDTLQAAFAGLTESEQEAFYRSAIKMIRNLQESGSLPVSRMCVRCRHFDPFRYPDSATPHHCRLVDAPFADRHLRIDCPEQACDDAAAQHALWVRFNSGPRSSDEENDPTRPRPHAAPGT